MAQLYHPPKGVFLVILEQVSQQIRGQLFHSLSFGKFNLAIHLRQASQSWLKSYLTHLKNQTQIPLSFALLALVERHLLELAIVVPRFFPQFTL